MSDSEIRCIDIHCDEQIGQKESYNKGFCIYDSRHIAICLGEGYALSMHTFLWALRADRACLGEGSSVSAKGVHGDGQSSSTRRVGTSESWLARHINTVCPAFMACSTTLHAVACGTDLLHRLVDPDR